MKDSTVSPAFPAPPADRFAVCPATWYLFGPSQEVRRRPVAKDLLGRRLVAFRSASGAVAILEGRCSHLGADLGRGRIVGDSIQCPFHHWEYAPDGNCRHIPAQDVIPAFARQHCYPAAERHGFVFFFNGPEPLFPLPFFFDCRPEDFVAGRPYRFVADCSWFLLAANGFDREHFAAVHDRTMTGPPRVDCPHPLARCMRYTARVTGGSVFDRLIRRFAGDPVEVTITSWGGPFILVTGFFHRARSYMIIATQPMPDGRTRVELIVFAPRAQKPWARLLRPVGLEVRRLLSRAFMRDDVDRLGGIRYNPHTLIEADRLLIDYFHWAAALPPGLVAGTAARVGPGANGACVRRPLPVNGISSKETQP